jgi:hypothetical protein
MRGRRDAHSFHGQTTADRRILDAVIQFFASSQVLNCRQLGLRGAADTVRAPRARDGRPRAGRAVVPRGAQRARVDRRGARERPVPAHRARHLRRRPAPRRAIVRGASRARPAAAVVARLARRARGAAEPGRAERARAARHGRRPAPAAAVAGGARHALGPRGAARRVGGAEAEVPCLRWPHHARPAEAGGNAARRRRAPAGEANGSG